MKAKRVWVGLLGLASLLCVFIGEFPFSFIPFAFFLYLSVPNQAPEGRGAERRTRSRAERREPRIVSATVLRAVHVLDPRGDEAPAGPEPAVGEPALPAPAVTVLEAELVIDEVEAPALEGAHEAQFPAVVTAREAACTLEKTLA